MTKQTTFVSFKDSKSPEERKQYVQEQLAIGNPTYKPYPVWYKQNENRIRLEKLEAQMEKILSKLPI